MAQRFGPSWWAVRDQPYHDTLEAYRSLLEIERIEGLEREHERLELGRVNNLGQSPDAFGREVRRHTGRLHRRPRVAPAPAKEHVLDAYMDFPLVKERRKPVS